MKPIILLSLCIVLTGCEEDTKDITLGWGPVGENYAIVVSQFRKGEAFGETVACDSECQKLWTAFGMDVAMGDLLRRNRTQFGYEYRKVKN